MGVVKDIQTDLEIASVKMMTECRSRLLVYALRICGNPTDAEDLVGSAFKEFFAHIEGYDSKKGELYPYLKGILDHLHARTKRRAVNRGTVAVDPSVLESDETLVTTCTEDEILANSDHDALRAAIGRLSPKSREVILLHYFSELPVAKVARVLGISGGTVKWRLNMARKALATDLGRTFDCGKKSLAVILAALLSLVSAAAVATLPAFEPLRATVAGWFGASVETPAETPFRAAEPTDQEETKTNEQFEVVKEETQEMNKITNAIAAAVSATVLSTNAAAAESSASQPAKTAAVQSAAPVKLAATAPVLKLNAAPGGTRVWTGATSGDWHTPTNWDPEGVPTADDDIVLAAPEEGSYTVTASQAIEVHSLTVGSDTAGTDCLATFESKTNSVHRIGGNLVVKSGGKLTHTALPASAKTPADECYKLNLQVGGSVTVAAEGTIDVTSRGYASGKGPGYNINAGPSHGGRHATGAATYGSLSSPTNCGSGFGSAGGGAVRIVAEGRITVNGNIVSSSDFNNSYCSGAGGSVWLTCSDLQGSGMISVQGGDDCYGSAGSGGRLAIWLTKSSGFDWNGQFIAKGGTYRGSSAVGTGTASSGTIYLQPASGATASTVVIDNCNRAQFKDVGFVELCACNDSDVFGSLVVVSNGVVKVPPGETIKVYGSINTTGGSAYWTDGAVRMVGFAPATISGSNTFGDFICTEPGKTIFFGTKASDNFEIAAGRKLTLKGAVGKDIDLRSANDPLQWKMKVNLDVETEIFYVSVSNSNAKAGEVVTAYGSEDLGGNEKWNFTDVIVPGETITWTGAVDSDWTNPLNWNLGRKVVETDMAVIPSAIDEEPVTTMPVLDKGKVLINEVRIESGATVTLKGYDLTVTNKLIVTGTLTALGKEKIFCPKDVDFTGGTFVAGGSSFVFYGSGAQQVNLDGQAFSTITIEKDTGGIAFADGFKAEFLDVHGTDAMTLVFAAGKTVDAARLVLRGERKGGVPTLLLRSSAEGTPWKLKSGTAQFIAGVDVKDSDASAGEWARTDFTSTDSRNNTHWDFGAGGVTNAQWIGTSGSFATAENWSTCKVPDGNTRVFIRASDGEERVVTASAAIFVHDLILQGEGTGVATFESATMETHRIAGELAVNFGGKMTHTQSNDESKKLNLEVGGNVMVAADGTIDVTSRGYASGKGPGYNASVGPSHGGRHTAGAAAYGSLSSPTNCGSGYGTAGGGVVRIVAEGRITVNGDIVSSADFNNSFCSGAGGSVWLTCSDLQGSGMISVQGGDDYYGSAGSGGRIAVWLTKASGFDWNGRFIAKGGTYRSSSSGGGTGSAPPGTIYLQAAGGNVKTATVIIDNGNLTKFKDVGYVEICAAAGWKDVGKIVVQNNALVKLAQNMRIGDLDMATKNAKINVGTNILTIRYPAHKGGRNWADMFDNHVIKETDPDTGRSGDIVWKGQGFAFFIK